MDVFTGIVWLIFSQSFQGFLKIPQKGKPEFVENCNENTFLRYHVSTPACLAGSDDDTVVMPDSAQAPADMVLSTFESLQNPGRYLAFGCNRLTARRRANITNVLFELQSLGGGNFQLISKKTAKTLTVSRNGTAHFLNSSLVKASSLLQLKASLKVIAVEQKEDPVSMCQDAAAELLS